MMIRCTRLPGLLVYSLLLLIPVLSVSQQLGENWHFVDETNWQNSTLLKKTAVAPIIDGQIDKVWNATEWHPYQVFWSENQEVPPDFADLYFEWKGLWDDTTLYLLCHVVDDWVIYNPALVDWWKQDALEITIRPDGSNSGKRDVDPAHWINLFPDPDREENLIRYMHPADHPDFQAVLYRAENTELFVTELYYEMKWTSWLTMLPGLAPVAGDSVRIAFQVDEDDEGDVVRETMLTWPSTTDPYRGAEYWGKLILSAETVTSAKSKDVIIPSEFTLLQNYPNPFNPSTSIPYALVSSAKVNLSVFNILGQLVKTLVDDNQKAGSYTILWDGFTDSALPVPTGIYFYKLKVFDGMNIFEKVRNMALVK